MIVAAALQEDVDVIGLSSLSGAHLELFGDIMKGLKEKGMEGVRVAAGGIIPEEDVPALKEMGIAAVFGPGARTSDIVEQVRRLAGDRG
jgi:methylmalonyl-CoA mutase C-terminal domain/subunit